jgi:tetratricopeptide (TPR) repeat protein
MMGELGDRHGQANTWDSLGYIHHQLGNADQAVDCYRHALDLFRQTGERYLEAETLIRLGDTYLDTDEPASARTAWTAALHIFTELDHPDASSVRTKPCQGVPSGTP